MKKIRLFILLSALVILALVSVGNAAAANPPCLSPADGVSPGKCVTAILTPATLIGDAYIDGILLDSDYLGVNVAGWTIIPSYTTVTVEFRNIREASNPTDPNLGVWYTYPDASKVVTLGAEGSYVTAKLTSKKTFLTGKLELACDIKNHAGEDVSCGVTIDGAAPASNATLTPGQKASYFLTPGAHTVAVTLAGANANLWAPATFSKQVNIKASATVTKLKADFKKAGHLLVSLDQPGVVGDWYLDGVQVGTQVATLDQWVTPGGSHKVEVKNLTDPQLGAGHWADVSKSLNVASGKEKSVVLKLKAVVADVSGFVAAWFVHNQ